MALGQRIKQARLEAGLSQRQLCGDTITRNMLSLIESGKARPGMDTLTVLASRLGKPVSWLLEEDVVVSPEQAVLEQARQAYCREDFTQVIRILETLAVPGPEEKLLMLLCLCRAGEQALAQGKNVYARSLLDKAEQVAEDCIYICPALGYWRLFLEAKAGGKLGAELVGLADQLLLLEGASFSPEQGAKALDAMVNRDDDWYCRRGKIYVERGEYARGAELLHRVEDRYPQVCAPLLEVCYRELGDYKRAYEYACRQKN